MKTIAIILGLAAAALAQQPDTEPVATLHPHPPRLLVKEPFMVGAFLRTCPTTVILTENEDAAQYFLTYSWSSWTSWWNFYSKHVSAEVPVIAHTHWQGALFARDGDAKGHFASSTPTKMAFQVCQFFGATPPKLYIEPHTGKDHWDSVWLAGELTRRCPDDVLVTDALNEAAFRLTMAPGNSSLATTRRDVPPADGRRVLPSKPMKAYKVYWSSNLAKDVCRFFKTYR